LARLIDTRGGVRIEDKAFNDWLLLTALQCIRKTRNQHGRLKPIQLHTGYGDSDISLVYSNPAYLQPLIEKFPDIDFVLLHSAYPFTREAGYLAEVFPNVYLDLSLVFPMVSRDGQESIVIESLNLAPSSKLLWSTDGHSHPESYWLATRQFREILEHVRSLPT
jgi:predicted TIM-barrel fold metal-dependent hydrolase